MNRLSRIVVATVVALGVVLAPAPAVASDENLAVAINEVDGAAVVDASVQYRKAANGVVDERNVAVARARCIDCKTVAVAFQLVLITKDWHQYTPHNSGEGTNVLCTECVTMGVAKQVLVETGGPAALSENGHARLRAVEARLKALEAGLPSMSVEALVAEVDAAFAEFLDVATTEIVRTGG